MYSLLHYYLMLERVRLRSLAKINLDLRVLHKRPDGFHELRTIFQTISLADTIEIEYQRGRTRIELKSNLNIPDNLIVRAADMLLEAAGETGRLRFALTKRIPLGGGLGRRFQQCRRGAACAAGSARKAGSARNTAWNWRPSWAATSRFSCLAARRSGWAAAPNSIRLPDLPSRPGLVITPGIHSSTPEAYRALDRQASRRTSPPT